MYAKIKDISVNYNTKMINVLVVEILKKKYSHFNDNTNVFGMEY